MGNSDIKILVVEDEDSLREVLVDVFEDEDYQVDAAKDGSEAWELLSQNQYHVMVTDLYMPVMNGVELIRKCRQSFLHTKIILVSGGGKNIEARHGFDFVKIEGEEVKVDMFLKKPYRLEEMLTATEQLI